MRTKLLVPAALAVAIGLSSWIAGAATPNTDASPVATTTPAYATDMQAAKSAMGDQPPTVYVSKSFGEPAPSARPRAATADRSFKTGVGPALMFQLREAAGG
jgi:hypothetical protein